MAKTLYTAEAQVTGGRDEGHGKTSDGALEVDLRVPSEMGGDGGGTNPEQLFAVGYASCFESALKVMARRQRVESGDATIDSKVNLHPTQGGRLRAVGGPRRFAALDRRRRRGASSWSRRPTRCARTRTPRAATST